MFYALGFGDLAASIIALFFWSNAVRIFFCSPLALFNQFAFENVCSFHELTLSADTGALAGIVRVSCQD